MFKVDLKYSYVHSFEERANVHIVNEFNYY